MTVEEEDDSIFRCGYVTEAGVVEAEPDGGVKVRVGKRSPWGGDGGNGREANGLESVDAAGDVWLVRRLKVEVEDELLPTASASFSALLGSGWSSSSSSCRVASVSCGGEKKRLPLSLVLGLLLLLQRSGDIMPAALGELGTLPAGLLP